MVVGLDKGRGHAQGRGQGEAHESYKIAVIKDNTFHDACSATTAREDCSRHGLPS